MYGALFFMCIIVMIVLVILDSLKLWHWRTLELLQNDSTGVHVVLVYSSEARTCMQIRAVKKYMHRTCLYIYVLHTTSQTFVHDAVYCIQYKTTEPFFELPALLDSDEPILWLGTHIIPVNNIVLSTFLHNDKWIICNTPLDAFYMDTYTSLPIPLLPLLLTTIEECGTLERVWTALFSRTDVIFDGGHLGVITRLVGIKSVDECVVQYALQVRNPTRKKQKWMIVYEPPNCHTSDTIDLLFSSLFL